MIKKFSGVVTILDSDGTIIDSEVRSFQATEMAWHPTKIILAVGWSTGLVSLWDGTSKDRREVSEISNGDPISQLIWSSPGGKRLVTGTESGDVKAWRTNGKTQLQRNPAWEFNLEGKINSILCRPQDGASSDLAKLAVAAVSGGV